MSSEFTIKVDGVGKNYHIYDKPLHRLMQTLRGGKKTYYRDFWALRDISFEIKKGETVGIIGRNGSGKSTLLQMICGTLTPTTGNIDVNGRVAALLELGAGFNPEFTGRENVYLNASILGLSETEIDEKYTKIVEFSEIGEFIDQPVKTYSSGMYVRLAFAVMAHVDAEILVIDEALAVGDVFFTQKCMRFLHEFKIKSTIIFVTHDTGAVVSLCDRAVWLEHGELKSIGEAQHVCEKYLAARYDSPVFVSENHDNEKSHVNLNEQNSSRHDSRMKFINHSNLRNDIEVFDFSPNTRGFGNGGAIITSAKLTNLDGQQLSWIVGGELVRIEIEATIRIACTNVIIGFQLKNKFGQVLFDQNSYVEYSLKPVAINPRGHVKGIFTFRLPLLPIGSYMVDVAIADGTPENATQLQWLHDAFSLESHASSTVSGMIGLIFESIELLVDSSDSK